MEGKRGEEEGSRLNRGEEERKNQEEGRRSGRGVSFGFQAISWKDLSLSSFSL